SDDMLKVGGIWVSPIEVENTLVAHEAVLEAAVVGQQDGEKLVKPKAYVVLKNTKDASQELAEELKEFVRNRIAPYKKTWWIDFVPSPPKTATGQIQRYRLRQRRARVTCLGQRPSATGSPFEHRPDPRSRCRISGTSGAVPTPSPIW